MEIQPMDEVDQVTALERAAQLRVLQAPAQDRSNHLVSISHFETVMEGAFIHETIAQNICDGVSHAVGMGCGIIDSW
jgi:hypothetical protein